MSDLKVVLVPHGDPCGERGCMAARYDKRILELEKERDAALTVMKEQRPAGWSDNAWFGVCDKLIAQEKRMRELEEALTAIEAQLEREDKALAMASIAAIARQVKGER